jgi:opacity protein-like surface antigen
MEIVPSIGVTRATDGAGSTQTYLGLAMRGSLGPMLRHETAIGYRSEEVYNGDLKMTTVPLTASVWFAPVPVIYAGGGVGMYASSLTYRDVLLIPNTSTRSFGVHLGGGLSFPVAPMLSIDLNGRYVFMEEQATALSQGNFDPDFWSTSAGVAIKF